MFPSQPTSTYMGHTVSEPQLHTASMMCQLHNTHPSMAARLSSPVRAVACPVALPTITPVAPITRTCPRAHTAPAPEAQPQPWCCIGPLQRPRTVQHPYGSLHPTGHTTRHMQPTTSPAIPNIARGCLHAFPAALHGCGAATGVSSAHQISRACAREAARMGPEMQPCHHRAARTAAMRRRALRPH